MRGDWKFPVWPSYKKVQETPVTVTKMWKGYLLSSWQEYVL